jgi:hypothetical protein
MGKPLPMDLRQRVIVFVEEGHSHRAAAGQFQVSVKFVNEMVPLKRGTGSLEAKPQGNGGGHGKLAGVRTSGMSAVARIRAQKRLSSITGWPSTSPGKRKGQPFGAALRRSRINGQRAMPIIGVERNHS